ncbi:MAG TPA: PadR family transcriptional regulator [Rectinemataceae bacterium]|nr:PadR family transcriptional regulator [Rectinemataceae bacterium]
MSIRYAILGFLSWKPHTGYELKKVFADALSFHWSGNNNQIYGTLVDLHKAEAVTIEVQQQEKLPARKVYTITAKGRAELRDWTCSDPELPVQRSMALTQLAWAEGLSEAEFDGILSAYARKLGDQVLMYRETLARNRAAPRRSPREELIWRSLDEHAVAFYERELEWAESLRTAAAALGPGDAEREALRLRGREGGLYDSNYHE